MQPRNKPARLAHAYAGASLFCVLTSLALGQAAAPDAQTLARYDTNRNGRIDSDEAAAMAADERQEEALVMSPFEVSADSRGYYAENTMSGTRLNTKLEDLASSITVVTKEQMSDFAALDINDIFMYEAGTEGIATYTDFSFDRNGYPTDNSSLAPQSSNRVRGLTNANTAFGNFATSGRVPIDPIITESVEISRGPNANIFGLGNAGGTVNIVPASANLSRGSTQVEFRGDNFDGYRSSLSHNQVVKKDFLALRVAGVYQHTGYDRKPSGTDTVRLDGMIKFRPFKYTTLSAFVEEYRIHGRMPNLTMPRDAVSNWKAAGSPLWDSLNRRIVLDGVPSASQYSISTLPTYFLNSTGTGRTNSLVMVDNDGSIDFWGPAQATTTANNPWTRNSNVFQVVTNAGQFVGQPMFQADPSLSDDSIYDWKSVNLAAMNYLSERTRTMNVSLEQFFINNARQVLALQLGMYAENSDRHRRDLAGGPTSQKFVGALYVDPNMYLPTGAPNPNVGRPFVGLWNPRSFISPLDNKNYRAQLAYRLDLRREKGILRWLGMQQLSAYGEYKDNRTRSMTFLDSMISGHAWIPPGTTRAFVAGNVTNNYFRYYVGDAEGTNVDYAPHSFTRGIYPYSYGAALGGASIITEQAELGAAASSGSGGSNNRQILKTHGVILQSYFLGDRIVTTAGIRRDRNYNRRGLPFALLPDGYTADMEAFGRWSEDDWGYNAGTTKTAGIVVKPLRWLNLSANVSDSFLPSEPGHNLHLVPVPDPTGKGYDLGFTANLLGGKVLVRFNHYKTEQINARDGQANTLGGRAIQIDLDSPNRNSTPFNLVTQATNWVTTLNPGWSESQVVAEVAKIAQIDPRYIIEDIGNEGQLAQTGDIIAKGEEMEVFFKPSDAWTVKFNLTRQESINGQMADDINIWLAKRLPVWEKIIDPLTGLNWFTAPYDTSGRNAKAFLEGSVLAPLKIAQATRGKSRPQIREWRGNLLSNVRFATLTDNRFLKRLQIGGAVRYESKGAIGYYGLQSLPDIITELDPNRPIYDKAHTYFDAFVTYRMKLFNNRVGTTFQLNVRNLTESGRLQPIQAYPDGTSIGYRIVDPRAIILTVKFDL